MHARPPSRPHRGSAPEPVPRRRLSRRHFIAGTGAAGAVAATGAVGASPAEAARSDLPPTIPIPEPIPGGFETVPGEPASFIHFWQPGPEGATTEFFGFPAMGLDVDPSTITNFSGDHAFAIVTGEAQGSDGNTYNMEFDIRVMKGSYVAADGIEREGAFAFL